MMEAKFYLAKMIFQLGWMKKNKCNTKTGICVGDTHFCGDGWNRSYRFRNNPEFLKKFPNKFASVKAVYDGSEMIESSTIGAKANGESWTVAKLETIDNQKCLSSICPGMILGKQ